MTIRWLPGVSALDVFVVLPHKGETPSGQKNCCFKCIVYKKKYYEYKIATFSICMDATFFGMSRFKQFSSYGCKK